MPDIAVPEQHKAAFMGIEGLNEDEFDALRGELDGLTQAGPLPISELTRHVVQSVPKLTTREAKDLIRALLSIETARVVHGFSLTAFANDVATSASLELTPQGSVSLARRIESLAKLRAIAVTAKARDVAAEHERVFHTVRMLTDIRPVFGDDAQEPPLGAVVSHVLRINAYSGGRNEDYFVALDNRDLKELERVVRRALEKNTSLDRTLDSIGFARFGEEEVE